MLFSGNGKEFLLLLPSKDLWFSTFVIKNKAFVLKIYLIKLVSGISVLKPVQSYTPIFLELVKKRQENHQVQGQPGYILRPCLKHQELTGDVAKGRALNYKLLSVLGLVLSTIGRKCKSL